MTKSSPNLGSGDRYAAIIGMGIQQVWELKDGGDIAEYQVRSPAPPFWGGWKSHRNDLKGLIFFKLAETTKTNTVGWK